VPSSAMPDGFNIFDYEKV